ncbi:hypothetical protein Brsp07_04161 [Brucella sp. NBRC 14130]
MPVSTTTPGRSSARNNALFRVAFRAPHTVGTRDQVPYAAQWPACAFSYRRFTDVLTDGGARLGANVDRYSFIEMDFHHSIPFRFLRRSWREPSLLPMGGGV